MDWLARRADRRPGRPALVADGRSHTYGELNQMVAAACGALVGQGVEPDQPVGLWTRNDLLSVVALWAVPRAGGVIVPLDPDGTDSAQRLEESGAMAVIGSPADASRADLRLLQAARLLDGPSHPGRSRAAGDRHSIVFTSGSSGRPKGVVLTWGNLEASARASGALLASGPQDLWLAVLPLFHVGGSSILWRSARDGGAVVLEGGFDPERAAARCVSGGVTLASLVPTMVRRLLGRIDGSSSLRVALVGGGPCPEDLVLEALESGMPIAPSYGMTETASQIATLLPPEAGRRPGSSGRPLPGAELTVVSKEGEQLPAGEPGRIQVRGRMVSPGYLGEGLGPPGGWFTTPDLGEIDDQGYLTVLGRADDVIVSGGEKVRPQDVESILLAHPSVADAAVFGRVDAEWGEAVVALVVPEPGLEAVALDGYLRARLAPHQVPKRWRLVEALPRTPLGKLDRGRLSAEDDGWISDWPDAPIS